MPRQPPGPPDSQMTGPPVGLDFTSLFWTTFHHYFELTKIIKIKLAPRREHRFHKIAGLKFESISGPILGSNIILAFDVSWNMLYVVVTMAVFPRPCAQVWCDMAVCPTCRCTFYQHRKDFVVHCAELDKDHEYLQVKTQVCPEFVWLMLKPKLYTPSRAHQGFQ